MRVSSETLSTRGRAGPGSQVSSVRALYLLLMWKRRMPSPYLFTAERKRRSVLANVKIQLKSLLGWALAHRDNRCGGLDSIGVLLSFGDRGRACGRGRSRRDDTASCPASLAIAPAERRFLSDVSAAGVPGMGWVGGGTPVVAVAACAVAVAASASSGASPKGSLFGAVVPRLAFLLEVLFASLRFGWRQRLRDNPWG